MSEPVITMEAVVVRARRPRTTRPDTVTPAAPGLSNRAAGRARAEVAAPDEPIPDKSPFGGFAYTRTEQDEEEVEVAGRPSPPRVSVPDGGTTASAETIERAGIREKVDPGPVASAASPFGGFAYTRTRQDEEEVAAARNSSPTRSPVRDRGATGPAEPAGAAAVPFEAGIAEAGAAIPGDIETSTGAAAAVRARPAGPASDTRAITGPSAATVRSPEDLMAAVRTAAAALPHETPSAVPLSAVYEPRLAAARARATRPRQIGGGRRIPLPRPIDPIEIDPVPEATKVITDALNARLPELALPALEPMPDGTRPRLAGAPKAGPDELAVEVPASQPGTGSATVNAAEAARARAAVAAAATTPVATVPAAVPIEPPVLIDFRPPPPPPLPPAQAQLEVGQTLRVLSIVLATVPQRAGHIVQAVRAAAFPPARMANHLEELTEPLYKAVQADLTTKMDQLRDAARIAPAVLAAAVEQRRHELEAHLEHVATEGELAVTRASAAQAAAAQRANARIEAARLRDEARRVQRLRLALHSRKPELVEELVAQRIAYIHRDVGRGVVAIEAAAARRKELIEGYREEYRDAYRRADDDFQARLPTEPRRPANLGENLWFDVVDDRLTAAMRTLTDRTTDDAAGLVATLRNAGIKAGAAVRDWADRRLHRSFVADNVRLQAVADARAQETAITAAQAQAEQNAVRTQLVGEIRFAAAAYLQAQHEAYGAGADRAGRLDADQMAIARHYLSAGSDRDPMSAVAGVLVGRYQKEHHEQQTAELREQVYAIRPGREAEAKDLAAIYFPGGDGALGVRADRLRRALTVWHGTAEEEVVVALTGVDGPAMALLNQYYNIVFGESLQQRIEQQMSGSDRDQASGLAGNDGSATAAQARARHARGVIADSKGWLSNDPGRALDAIRALPPGEAAAVVDDRETRAHLVSVLGGRRWVESRGTVTEDRGEKELRILLDINRMSRNPGESPPGAIRDLQAQADAIELDRYIRPGTFADAPDIDRLFARIRTSVLAEPGAAAWSAEEVDNEVRRRTRAMENAYERKFGAELPTGGISALRTAIAWNLRGTRREIALDLLDVDRAGERAARLQRTTEGLYTSDSELNAELERTYQDALAEVRRSESCRRQVEERAQSLMDRDGITDDGRRPAAAEIEAYQREATEEIARELAQQWMSDVSRTFGARYAGRWGGKAQGALQNMVAATTQFGGAEEARSRLAGGGGLTAAQSVRFGVVGWGMDRDPVLRALTGRTKQQIARIGAEYIREVDGEDMVSRLRSETGGWTADTKYTVLERDAFDLREALGGVPTTAAEELAAATRRYQYERDVYFKNNPRERDNAVGPELAMLERSYRRATERYEAYESAVRSGDAGAIRRAEVSVRAAREATNAVADHYREAVDAYVDRTAQIVAASAAITAAVLVTAATGGTAGPVVLGLAASLAGTAATVATKQDILGAAYSRQALTDDLIVGVVDAVVTVLTAGLGDKLLRVIEPVGATKAALRRAAAFAAEQVVQSVPTSVTAAALDRGTWQGDPLRNLATSAGMAALVGIGVGAAVHGVMKYAPKALGAAVDTIRALRSGSGADIAADRVLLRSTSESLAAGVVSHDLSARRGSPVERLAARREYLRRFPDRTPADFDRALARGTADAVASAEAVREVRREMMRHFLSGIPAAERGRFVDTPIIVLPDVEFTARTGSEFRGHAVTLVVAGEPVVVLREGAPLSALREEGKHARQIRDVLNAERVALLDERRLAQWASTSLEDRAAAWHAKLDLELEVQSRLMSEYDAELSRPGLTTERAADLVDRFEDARAAFDVLSERRGMLLDLDAGDFDRIRIGDLDPPPFLAEVPRLFAKKAPTAEEFGVRMVGPERVFRGKVITEGSRRSRWVQVYDDFGNVVEKYEERLGERGWVRSGRTSRWAGGVAELAMRMENARPAGGKGVKRVQLDAQTPQGWGFDDVIIETRRSGGVVHAKIIVGEAKHYTGSVNDFSAIDSNFRKNLKRVRDRLIELLRTDTFMAVGLDETEVRAALEAVDERRVQVEVRAGQSTRIAAGTLEAIQTRLRSFGKNISVVRGTDIARESIAEAEHWWATVERYRLGGTEGMAESDARLFRELARRPTGVTPDSIATAEAVMLALRAQKSPIADGIEWEPGGRYLVDGEGRPFVVDIVRGEKFDAEDVAHRILALADQTPPGASASALARVIVSCEQLTPTQAAQLQHALSRQAKAGNRRAALDRVLAVAVQGDAKPGSSR
ncbi:hypothetical protein [Nocardia jinanensis]|uniref:Uncharacterized protein n=1 Tax=Nocardia jinanensis TaxID=382504 RepID=A0A917VU20_9NOCA|nr:hypothetical protein [Nocardia jinanensis]GGL14585.1 hypothetical protein GCM10011588_31380 [Nocardia jinanensis]